MKGLNDKGVAYSVIDKDPGSIREAIKLVHAYKGYRVLLDKDIYLDSSQQDGNCSNMMRGEDNNLNTNYGGVVGTRKLALIGGGGRIAILIRIMGGSRKPQKLVLI